MKMAFNVAWVTDSEVVLASAAMPPVFVYSAESTVGEGSTFTFTVPITRGEEAEPARSEASQQLARLRGRSSAEP